MLNNKVQDALNKQIKLEAESSQFYLSMAIWAEVKGYEGIATFMYDHSDEERMHMLKLIKYVNERGGQAIVPALPQPPSQFESVKNVFGTLQAHEEKVSNSINEVVEVCLQEKDYSTHNFMQWYVKEQIEEEALARTINDKINMMGPEMSSNGGLFFFDREINSFGANSAAMAKGAEA
ncbi:MAG: ferritin [Luteibaculaceae bacterium]